MAIANYEKDLLFDSNGLNKFSQNYLKPHEKSPQDRYVYVSNFFSTDSDHAKRLYAYSSNHWLSFSTPILNFYNDENTLPISCYLCYLPDTLKGLLYTLSEVNNLSTMGGGVSVKINIRSPSEKSVGAITHIKTYDACCLAYKQGYRRGSYAMYMDINHPEILQFLELRKPTGDYNVRALNIHHGVCITDDFMKIIESCETDKDFDDTFELIDPHTKLCKRTISAKYIWEKIIEIRLQTGEPFIFFTDTCNEYMNKYQKKIGLKITQSNLCTEIIVPTDENRSSVCCLASVNMEYYDDWKSNKKNLQDIMLMLDNVLNVFQNIAEKRKDNLFDRVLISPKHERNIGIGLMGFVSYLQKHTIPLESVKAKEINKEVFSFIQKTTDDFNFVLGDLLGSPIDIVGSGKRFSYLMAVAPTAATSILMPNASPCIEPYRANIFRHDTNTGSTQVKNKFLEKLLIRKGFSEKIIDKIWKSILFNNGSVQNLPSGVLSPTEKLVFKTFMEYDQKVLIELAADRQQYIDQGQSLTLTFGPNTSVKELHDIHMLAWRRKLKTLYYCRSEKLVKINNIEKDPMECELCQ